MTAGLLVLLLAGSTPSLTPPPERAFAPPRTVLSLRLPALLASGVDMQGERYLEDTAWSVAVGLGGRRQAGGDFRSWRFGAGGEVRRWLWRGGWLASLRGEPLGGLYVGGRVDAAWGRTDTVEGRFLGSDVQVEESVQVGYRLWPLWSLELTPAVGLGLTHRFDATGRLSPHTRWHQTLGLTAGWAF